MTLFFPILFVVVFSLASALFSIFIPNITHLFPLITSYEHVINITFSTLITLSITWLFDAITIKAVTHAFASVLKKNPLAQKLLPITKLAIRLLVWAIGAITVISGLGYDVTSLLTGAGIGGLVFALAGKELASNLLGSLSLVFWKLFSIGDTIRVKKDFQGEVVEISLSRTKLIDKDGVSVYVPNKFIISEVVENLGNIAENPTSSTTK